MNRTFDAYWQQFAHERRKPAFAAIESVILTLPGPLPRSRIIELAHHVTLEAAADHVFAAVLDLLVQEQYAEQHEHMYWLVDAQYRNAWWEFPDSTPRRRHVLQQIATWRADCDTVRYDQISSPPPYPIELLRILADPLILSMPDACTLVLPQPAQLLVDRVPRMPYQIWCNLARAYYAHGLHQEFRYPARTVQQTFRCSQLDTAVLELLITLVTQQQPVRQRDALWGIFCQQWQQVLQRWISTNEQNPLALVIQEAQYESCTSQHIRVIEQELRRCTSAQRLLAFHWVLVPLLWHVWCDELHKAIEPFVDNPTRLQLALALAIIARHRGGQPAQIQAQRWFTQLRQDPAFRDMHTFHTLWITLLPPLSRHQPLSHAQHPDIQAIWNQLLSSSQEGVQRDLIIAEQVILRRYFSNAQLAELPRSSDGWIAATFAEIALQCDHDKNVDHEWDRFVARYQHNDAGTSLLDRMVRIYVLCCALLGQAPLGHTVRQYLIKRAEYVLRPYLPEICIVLAPLLDDNDDTTRQVLIHALRELIGTPLELHLLSEEWLWLPRTLVLTSDLCALWHAVLHQIEFPQLIDDLTTDSLDTSDVSANNPHLAQAMKAQLEQLLDSVEVHLFESITENPAYSAADPEIAEQWVKRWQRNAAHDIQRLLDQGLF